jgi:hypothetical protein
VRRLVSREISPDVKVLVLPLMFLPLIQVCLAQHASSVFGPSADEQAPT